MEWEQCKENIKPKREGRNISHIVTTPKGAPMMAQIQEKQAAFEREIKEYQGDDELAVWVKYVHYMEDAFPEGDYLSNVGTLQFRLIKRFQDKEEYKQDPRLLRIFLDLANHSIHATDIYAYCYYHDLVTGFSKFWSNWITSWIYKQRYDKALKICDKAIGIFKNTSTFRGIKLQLLHAMDSSKTDNMLDRQYDGQQEFRKVGDQLFRDSSQNQLPGPASRTNSSNKQFSIFKDKNAPSDSIPSMSANPLETKVINKENAERRKQRWKHVIAETDSVAPVGKPFSIFEELSESNQEKQKYEKSSTALKAKKVAKVEETPSSSKVPVLKGNTNIVSTVAYHKSKVYPFTGEEWSFEEIEAQRRFSVKNNSPSSSQNSSKRSLDDADDGSERERKKRKSSESQLFDLSSSTTKPLKSCLANTSAITDFSASSIMSSTKKNICKEPDEDEKSVMAPNFEDKDVIRNRSSLNLSARSESSLFLSDFKKPVEDSIKLASKRSETDSESDSRDKDLLGDDGKSDFTFKGLQSSIGIPDMKSQFAIYEDTMLRDKKSEGQLKEPAIIKSAFTKKKLKLQSPVKPADSKPAFEIFSDPSETIEKKSGLDDQFNLEKINYDGRPSDAFKIFNKTPEKSVEESYSLKKVTLTPCDNPVNPSYVPCTVERMGKRSSASDTQLIQRQVMNILNDCSRISEADENSLCRAEEPTSRTDANGSKVQHEPERIELPPKPSFSVFSDADPAADDSLPSKESMVIPFSQEEFDENKKQLTPILEKSENSSCSSSFGNKTSNVLTTSKFDKSGSVIYEKTQFIDGRRMSDVTRRSIEGTVVVTKNPGRDFAIPSQQVTREARHHFYPDRTNRDVHLDCTLLTRVPRTSCVFTQPVTDPYDQELMEQLVQSLDPPLFYRHTFNRHEFDLPLTTQITLGALSVKNITQVGEGAFAKVYSGDCQADDNAVETKAFKIQSPPCPWEYYILMELSKRMSEDEIAREVQDMILPCHSIHVFNNSSVLVTNLFTEGSLLDMMNHYSSVKKSVPGIVILTYALDLMRCVDAIHRTQIIHGDIKPDNLLLRDKENTMQSISMKMTKSIVLIDFGRSIDMSILPADSKFTVCSKTEMFECVEMQTGKPWTYQVDYYGMLSCIHLMIHNEYMEVYQDTRSGLWKPTKKPHRRVDQELFTKLFTDLLNIPDCDHIPSLSGYIELFEQKIKSETPKERYNELKSHYFFMNT